MSILTSLTSLTTSTSRTSHTGLRARNPRASRLGALALGLALAGSLAAGGDDSADAGEGSTPPAAESVTVSDAWVRATEGAKDTSMTAAFMVLDNEGSEDVELVGASTEIAGRTELHEMAMQDGKAVMRKIDGGLSLRAGSGQLLQPGGNHIMLMDVAEPVAAGDEVEVVLEFSDGSTTSVQAPVKAFTEEKGHYHAPGTPEHTH